MPDIYPYAGYLPAGGWHHEARVAIMKEMSESRGPATQIHGSIGAHRPLPARSYGIGIGG